MYIGRKFLNTGNGTFQQIGKYFGGQFRYHVPGSNTASKTDINFEVLTCSPCKNGGEGPCRSLLLTFDHFI